MLKSRVILLCVALISIFACETEEIKEPLPGTFWIGERPYPLSGAYFTGWLNEDSIPLVRLALYSGFEYNEGSTTIGHLTGIGNMLEITCRSSHTDQLFPAFYPLGEENDSYTLLNSQLTLRYTLGSNQGDSLLFKEGNIVISGTPENMHLIYFFRSHSGTELSGHYQGKVRHYRLREDQHVNNP